MLIKQVQFSGTSTNGEVFCRPLHVGGMQKTAEAISMRSKLHPKVQDFVRSVRPTPAGIYVLVNALGAGEYWGANVNGDFFPEKGLIHAPPNWEDLLSYPEEARRVGSSWEYGFSTFMGAFPYKHHANKDPSRAFGRVELATWNPQMHRAELIVYLDRALCMQFDALDIVERIERGEFPDVSMGCKVPFDTCMICQHKSKTRADYCQHALTMMNKILPDGRKVCVSNEFPKFFDISFVFIGADKTAKVMAKLAQKGQQLCMGDFCSVPRLSVDVGNVFSKTADPVDEITWNFGISKEQAKEDQIRDQRRKNSLDTSLEKQAVSKEWIYEKVRNAAGKVSNERLNAFHERMGNRLWRNNPRELLPNRNTLPKSLDIQAWPNTRATSSVNEGLKQLVAPNKDINSEAAAVARKAVFDAKRGVPLEVGLKDTDSFTMQGPINREVPAQEFLAPYKKPSPVPNSPPISNSPAPTPQVANSSVSNPAVSSPPISAPPVSNNQIPNHPVSSSPIANPVANPTTSTPAVANTTKNRNLLPLAGLAAGYGGYRYLTRKPEENTQDKIATKRERFNSALLGGGIGIGAGYAGNKAIKADKDSIKKDVVKDGVAGALAGALAKIAMKDISGVPVVVEWKAGDERVLKNKSRIRMTADYGYIPGTKDYDGEELDVYIGKNKTSKKAYVIKQLKSDGSFDEHKVMLGFLSSESAKSTYIDHMKNAPTKFGGIVEIPTSSLVALFGDNKEKKASCACEGACSSINKLASSIFPTVNEKAASHAKLSEIIKAIPAGPFSKETLPKLENSEKDIPNNIIDQMGSMPLERSLSTIAMMGMVLKPREFQRLVLINIGERPLANSMSKERKTFESSNEIDESIPIERNNVDSILMDILCNEGLISERSAAGPALSRRTMAAEAADKPFKPIKSEERVSSDPVMKKIAALYNGYRISLLKKAASISDYMTVNPQLQSDIFGSSMVKAFAGGFDKVATSSAFSPDSLAYLVGAYNDWDMPMTKVVIASLANTGAITGDA